MFRFGLRPGSRFAGGVHCVVQVDEPKPVARCTAGRLKLVERAVYSARFFGRGEVDVSDILVSDILVSGILVSSISSHVFSDTFVDDLSLDSFL